MTVPTIPIFLTWIFDVNGSITGGVLSLFIASGFAIHDWGRAKPRFYSFRNSLIVSVLLFCAIDVWEAQSLTKVGSVMLAAVDLVYGVILFCLPVLIVHVAVRRFLEATFK